MLQPETMRIYLRVAELASFSAAAESLGLPRASVSLAVQRLEAGLGTRLLHRTTRRVQMTHDGRAFFERCRDVLADLEELQALFGDSPAELRGRLRVDMPAAVARDVVIPALAGFLAAHPGLELELSSTDRRVDVVREGFDCVLRVGQLADSSLVARTLGHYRMINCASPAYLARHGTPASPDDLATHRLVHYVGTLGARPAGFECVGEDGSPRFVPVAGTLTVNDSSAYESACLAGLGIIQVPAAGKADDLASGRLVEILPDHVAAPMPVSLLYPNRRHLPRRVQIFMQWLAELMAPRLTS